MQISRKYSGDIYAKVVQMLRKTLSPTEFRNQPVFAINIGRILAFQLFFANQSLQKINLTAIQCKGYANE